MAQWALGNSDYTDLPPGAEQVLQSPYGLRATIEAEGMTIDPIEVRVSPCAG